MPTDPRSVYRLFFNPGEVTEIRAFGLAGRSDAWAGFAKGDDAVVFGYFDNAEAFGKAAEALDKGNAHGVYFIPNLAAPESISKAENRLVVASKKRPQTSDHHIRVVRWLLLDFDPVRMAGVSSTDEELAAAMECAKAAAAYLEELGWQKPIKAASGNGYHLNYRIEDIECGDEYREAPLIKRCLAALAPKVNNERVKLDLAVFNPARIWKLYGTWARKGDHSPGKGRPHRQSYVFRDAPERLADVAATPLELVKQLAAMAPGDEVGKGKAEVGKGKADVPAKRGRPAGKTERMGGQAQGGLGKLDLEKYLSAYGRVVHSVDDHGALRRFNLAECVFNPEHKAKDAAVCQDTDGKLSYHCSHNSCQGRKWQDARAEISGSDDLKKYHEHYDPNWRSPDNQSLGSGILDEIKIVPAHVVVGAPALPPPLDIDPMEFFAVRGAHGRPAFVVEAMAKYLATYLAPIVCTDGVFWRYASGVWRRTKDETIDQIIAQALKDRVQADWIKSSRIVLGALVHQLEENWSRRPFVVNLKNGVIDLEDMMMSSGEKINIENILRPHDPAYGCRTQLAVEYQPEAEANRWIKTLWEIFPEGRECAENGQHCAGDDKITLLQQFAGYLLMPTCKFERAAFFVGPGANGKSTLMKAFIYLLGKENTVEMSLDDLARSFNIPYLMDKLLVTCTELVTREPSAVSVLKKCISGDMVSGEWKYKQRIDFFPTCKFVFALNEVPNIIDKSYGFVRKLMILKFDQRFEGDKKDVDLLDKLLEERAGIFLWMLEGAMDLIRRRGFIESDISDDEKIGFLQEMNPFLMWVAERAKVGPDQKAVSEHLYEDYRNWADKSGLNALGKIKFYHSVLNYLPAVKKAKVGDGDSRRHGFAGIGLKPI